MPITSLVTGSMKLAPIQESSKMARGAGFDIELKLHELNGKGPVVFDDWISLISRIERAFPDNIEKICLVYDSFLSEFPLCHGYWRRYADHKIRLCTVDEVVEVFERAVQSATYSVGVWVDYCYFSMSAFEDPSDICSFKKLAALCDKELGCQSNCFVNSPSHSLLDGEVPKSGGADEISCVVKDLFEPSLSFDKSKLLLQKYLSIGECLYQEACQLDEKIRTFETKIRRSYFHVKPLDADQLDNWHHYLDFVEKQGDFDWVVKLYERCLIPCAHYPEFWMRYVDFMETKGGREIANYALDRATQVFLKRVPVILLFNARFKEHEGNVTATRSTLLQCDDVELDLNFIENIVIKANMEKRLGNFVAASNIFEEALAMAAEKKKLHTLPNIYVHFSRLKYMIESADAARDILIDGIKRLPDCKLLLEQFIDLCGTIHELRKAWNRHIRLFPCSVRTAFNEQITTNIKSSKLAKEEKEDTIVTKPQQPSRDCNPDCLVKLPLEDKKMSRLENYDSGSDQDSTNNISEQKVPVGENDDIQFEQAHIYRFQSGEADGDAPKGAILPSLEVSKQLMKDVPETNVSLVSPEASEQPREDNTKCEVVEGTESEQALKEHSGGNDIKQKCDHEPEKDTKTLSLDSLSLHAWDNTYIDSHPSVSPACEAPQETRNFDGHMLESNQHNVLEGSLTCSQRKTNSSDSPRAEIEVVNISPSSSHQSPILTGPPHQRIRANSSGNRHQMNNSGKFRRESKFGSRGHLQRRSYQHQRQVSPLQHLRAEPGGPMPTSQGYPSQVASPHSPQSQQGSQAQHQYQATRPASVTPPPPKRFIGTQWNESVGAGTSITYCGFSGEYKCATCFVIDINTPIEEAGLWLWPFRLTEKFHQQMLENHTHLLHLSNSQQQSRGEEWHSSTGATIDSAKSREIEGNYRYLTWLEL
ncbi:hypothetical protein TIFTF001_012560 [Ficus carica]|uniref:Uncharacterized protein n=1 Tax=Ficus carica TaxID=3494 RepID=A0AA88A2L2_FICCA|nr:hypothetical protein TIFTF001_012560 [Ficus carica]